MKLTPKNWASFQHYKDRSPAWIKLHRGMLDDYDFACLPVASRALAPMLWLLASEYEDGVITATTDEIAFRLRMPREDLELALKPLIIKKFFGSDTEVLAPRKQEAMPEREKEGQGETEEEGERPSPSGSGSVAIQPSKVKRPPAPPPASRGSRLSQDWKPSPDNFDEGRAIGLTEVEIAKEVKVFRDYWVAKAGKDAVKIDWDATWRNWLRRTAERLGRAPPAPPPSASSIIVKPTTEQWKVRLRAYAATSNWDAGWGPMPGDRGCQVPPELLPDKEPPLL